MIIRRFPALIVAFFLAAAGISAGAQSQSAKTYTVSDIVQLLKAVGPDRTIVLRKGDYKLSSGYSVTSEYVDWFEGDSGKGLELSGLKNLTIRGADGARIISDASMSTILTVFESQGITIDNVVFTRTAAAGENAGSGSLYADSIENLVIDRCVFEGGTYVAINLWECSNVKIRRTRISGAYSGALYASYSTDIEISGSTIEGCEGYPLIYTEESGPVTFESSLFEWNIGSNFVEYYPFDLDVQTLVFKNCDFKNNDYEFFLGSPDFPETLSCTFEGNSFGEDWAESSVALSDEDYYGGDEYYDGEYDEEYSEYAYFEHSSGLAFEYPSYWELRDDSYKSRAGVFSPYGSTFVLILTPYQLPAKIDVVAQRQKIFADALAALAKSLKDESALVLSVKAEGQIGDEAGLVFQEYRGSATMGKDGYVVARVKLIIYGGKVHALVGMAKDESSLDVDTDADYVFSSIAAHE